MQFIVTGHDGTDEGALSRRMAAREAHMARCKAAREAGTLLYAVAMLNDAGNMCGSVLVCDFADRAALDAWLGEEPYVTGKVWETVDICAGKVPPLFQV
ncbi:MAG: hypothetical protein KGQ70_05175 [Alphaproteobacteria bacterium]|nr:hypothetical protein [Alphaproteobacteria bacterium]